MSTYESLGVSADKRGVLAALVGTSRTIFPGGFAQAIPDVLSGSAEDCILLHADGAGTKSSLAYMWWKETGDTSVFRSIAEDSLVMNLDDLCCVGATGPFVLSNLIGRNAKIIPDEIVSEVVRGYIGLAERLSPYGVEVLLCGGETADVGDIVRTIAVDSVLATRMPRTEFINVDKVQPGLAIVGLASFGRAPWEVAENSGIGTNGFTALRHQLLSSTYKQQYPETYDPSINDLAYTGHCDLLDPLPGTESSVGAALLCPTRTYAPVLKSVLDQYRPGIEGIIHNSGGGLVKCLNFGTGVRYVKDHLFPLPPIFAFVHQETQLPIRELVRVFNLGQRMEIICDPAIADEICEVAGGFDVAAQVIGRVERCEQGVEVVIEVAGERVEFRRNTD